MYEQPLATVEPVGEVVSEPASVDAVGEGPPLPDADGEPRPAQSSLASDQARPPGSADTKSSSATAATPVGKSVAGAYHKVAVVHYRRGWLGLFAGENQTDALQQALTELSASRLAVVATVRDRWALWRLLGSVLLAVVTLGFVVRTPNLLLITAPLRDETKQGDPGASLHAPGT